MAKVFKVTLATGTKVVLVAAETSEEATKKVTPQETETIVEVSEQGDIIL